MKKKCESYFPLEANILNDVHVSELICTYGAKGLGIYIMVLTELRKCANYRYNYNAAKVLAKSCDTSLKMLNKVVLSFNLFEFTEVDGKVLISSPYLDRVMGAYDRKLEKLAESGRKGYDKVGRDATGKFTADGGGIEKNRIEKNKTTTAVVVDDAAAAADDDEAVNVETHICVSRIHPAELETQICVSTNPGRQLYTGCWEQRNFLQAKEKLSSRRNETFFKLKRKFHFTRMKPSLLFLSG